MKAFTLGLFILTFTSSVFAECSKVKNLEVTRGKDFVIVKLENNMRFGVQTESERLMISTAFSNDLELCFTGSSTYGEGDIKPVGKLTLNR